MALGRAGGSERKRAAHNSALLARATRRTRALRLEHDPQPGLNGCTVRRRRGFFTTDGFGLAGKPPYPDVLKGLGSFRSSRRSVKAELTSGGPQCPFRKGTGFFAVAGCPNAANPDSQPSAALTYGSGRGMASEGFCSRSSGRSARPDLLPTRQDCRKMHSWRFRLPFRLPEPVPA